MTSFTEALEKQFKLFAVYTLSLISAFSFKDAIFHSKAYKNTSKWYSAFIIITSSLFLITIIVLIDPNDPDIHV